MKMEPNETNLESQEVIEMRVKESHNETVIEDEDTDVKIIGSASRAIIENGNGSSASIGEYSVSDVSHTSRRKDNKHDSVTVDEVIESQDSVEYSVSDVSPTKSSISRNIDYITAVDEVVPDVESQDSVDSIGACSLLDENRRGTFFTFCTDSPDVQAEMNWLQRTRGICLKVVLCIVLLAVLLSLFMTITVIILAIIYPTIYTSSLDFRRPMQPPDSDVIESTSNASNLIYDDFLTTTMSLISPNSSLIKNMSNARSFINAGSQMMTNFSNNSLLTTIRSFNWFSTK